jgi:hypothetical protein
MGKLEAKYIAYVLERYPHALLHATRVIQFGAEIPQFRIEADGLELSVAGLTSFIAWQNAADKIFLQENKNAL